MNETTGLENATKEFWQMTLAEFLATEPTKIVQRRPVSFAEWLSANDLPAEFQAQRNTMLPQLDYAFNQNRTKAQKGKSKGAYDRAAAHNQERDRLLARYASEVPTTAETVKLDLSRESDVAAARVMHRRAIRQALAAGVSVPPEVYSEATSRYPELTEIGEKAEVVETPAPALISNRDDLPRRPQQLAFSFA